VSSYVYRLEEELISFLKKANKKDKKLYEATIKKMNEIVTNPSHFKPLKYDLKGRRRVHIEKSFVLTFKIDEKAKIVTFIDLSHHDKVYKKK